MPSAISSGFTGEYPSTKPTGLGRFRGCARATSRAPGHYDHRTGVELSHSARATLHARRGSVPAFLQWVSREHGWLWEYDDVSLRHRVERIVLHGSIDGLAPEEALAAVLPTCGLAFRMGGNASS